MVLECGAVMVGWERKKRSALVLSDMWGCHRYPRGIRKDWEKGERGISVSQPCRVTTEVHLEWNFGNVERKGKRGEKRKRAPLVGGG